MPLLDIMMESFLDMAGTLRMSKNIFVAIFTLAVIITAAHGNSNPSFDDDDVLRYANIAEEEDNTFLGTIRADDADGEPLAYGIESAPSQYLTGGSGDAAEFLRVEPDGKVYIKQPIDRETYTGIRAAWTVTDGNVLVVQIPPVQMFIGDINDNEPYFESLPNQLAALPEDTEPGEGMVVLSITIKDPDNGLNGTTYAIITEEENVFCETEKFQVMPNDLDGVFDLVLNQSLSYDDQYEYTVCLQAKDYGTPPLNSTVRRVIIPIEDIQGSPPVFLNQPYDQTIPEDSGVGSYVLTVTAEDGDRGVTTPNTVLYQMESDEFLIDESSGEITVKDKLTRKVTSSYTLIVNATEVDESQPMYQVRSQTSVFVTVTDVDDEIPVFTPNQTSATITENAPVNSPLNMELNVDDGDTPEFAQFTLSLNQSLDAFRLESTEYTSTARVDVRVKDRSFLDYEKRTELKFQVVATTPNNLSSVAEVTVYITDENDNTPTFTASEYRGNFTEDAEEGEFILSVQAIDDDGDDVTYSTSATDFDIDPTTGMVTVGEGSFDAELRPQYTFTVTASDGGGRSGAVLVTLSCTDVNDEPPTFQRKEVTITEAEFDGAVPVDPIGSVQASDFDLTPPNNLVVYRILSGNEAGKFLIDSTGGDIYFADTVDFEAYQSFKLVIIAEDMGLPSLNDTATVVVTIRDINDNAPLFGKDAYDFSVYENATDGVLVGQVTATDLDSSYNGQVDYVISGGGQDHFFISTQGEIIVSQDLDRDDVAQYALTVRAQDRGTPQLTDECTVSISLVDINDKPPVFSQSLYEATVAEDEPVDTVIVTLSASDSDENSDLAFYIDSVVPDQPYQFHLSEDGILRINESLDYESVKSFTLGVIVEDRNTYEGESEDTATVVVTVTDVNDNAPQFENLPYNFTVPEESSTDTVVSTVVSALDDDEGDNGMVTYSLTDDAGGKIQIHPTSGTLTVSDNIDRETVELLLVTINAADNGDTSQSTSVPAYITVSDINDHSPIFDETLCTQLEVYENSEEGLPVCQVRADDQDSVFGVITYSIGGGNINGWFQINNVTGNISVASTPPDRESSDEVILTINAEDPGQRQATQDVRITILDENDNAPQFTVFTPNVDTAETIAADVALTQVVAEDMDQAGTNASVVRYEIIAGNNQDYWRLDPLDGTLYTAESLGNSAGTYQLQIVAYDLGLPEMRSDPGEMTINVKDVNDVSPTFIYPKVYEDPDNFTKEYINEGYNDTAMPLFRANATDTDLDDNGAILYQFVNIGEDWRHFRVDNFSGDVYYIGAPPDWYIQDIYKLTLEALNYLSETQLSSLVYFEVHVIDTIDSPPYFGDPDDPEASPPTQKLEKPENTDGAIGQVTVATDEDDSQAVYYFIVAGNDEGLFYMEKETGMIYANEVLSNIDGPTNYTLTVKVTNDPDFTANGTQRRKREAATAVDHSLLTVVIVVVDYNDNPPIFTESLYTAGVLYTVDFDVSVAQVQTTDLDTSEENTRVNYAIDEEMRINPKTDQSTPDDAFSVGLTSGIITTQNSFLSLTGGVYFEIVISATDPTKPEFTHTTNVFISVITEDQQLRVHINDSLTNFRATETGLESLFTEILEVYNGNTMKVSVDFDKNSTYTEDDGTPVPSESEVLFHVVELASYTVLPAEDILYALDRSPSYIDEVKDTYSVDTIFLASTPVAESINLAFLQWIVVALVGAIIMMLIFIGIAFSVAWKNHDRILRAHGLKTKRDIPRAHGKLLGAQANYGASNPVFNNQTYDEAFEEQINHQDDFLQGGDSDDFSSNASVQEAALDMEDDAADYMEVEDEIGDEGENSRALQNILTRHDEAAYATMIHMDGLDVSEV